MKPPLVELVLTVCAMFGSEAQAQCAREATSRIELGTSPGQLRLLDPGVAEPGRRALALPFSGSQWPIVGASPDLASQAPRQVAMSKVAWGSRLVSPGAEQVAVYALDRQAMVGWLVSGARSVVGGLIEMPGSAHRWTAFTLPATQREHLATLEYLYTLVLRADTGGTYTLRTFDACNQPADTVPLDQAGLLQEVAKRRNAVARDPADRDRPLQPWDAVSIRWAAAERPLMHNEVRAVVEDAQGPLMGAPIVFSRAPHAGCTATSDRQGMASCVLEDTHGDMDDDDDDAPIIATFSGIFSDDRMLPPVSAIVQR